MSSFRENFSADEQERMISDAMRNLGLERANAERMYDADRASKRNPLLDAQWVRTFHAVSRAIGDKTAHPVGLFGTVFWIRLYGVLNDLRARYRKSAELHANVSQAGKAHPFLAASAAVFQTRESRPQPARRGENQADDSDGSKTCGRQ